MKVNPLKAGVVLSYVSMILGYLVSIIYTPIMLRLLGQTEYGLYNLVASVVAYLGVLNFGFGSAYLRYYSRYKGLDAEEKISKLNGMFLIVFSFIGFIAVVAGFILAMNIEVVLGSKLTSAELSKAKVLMFILVINLAVSFPNIVFTSYITANERFIFQKFVQMIKTMTSPFIIIPVLFLGYGSVGMVYTITVLNIIIEITNFLYCKKNLKMNFNFKDFDFKLMKEMTVFSSFIFINLLVDQINWNVDKFILGRFHGTVSVAIYGLAAQLNGYYLSLSTAISKVFIPRVHRLVVAGNNEELTKLFTRIGRIQFMVLSLILSGLIFFGKSFITMWAGKNYTDSYQIVVLLVIPVTIPLIQNIGIEIQRAKNMHKFRTIVYFLIAIGNVFLTIPLARNYEGIGAATGTAIAILLGNGFIMNWYNHFKVGLDMKYFWKQILSFTKALVPPVIVGILINYFLSLENIIPFLFYGFIYVIIFAISMWKIGMNQYEKNLIGVPVKRLFTKFGR